MERHLRTAAGALVVVSAAMPLRAQLSVNPVQDFINRTTTLNNVLSSGRAVHMSQAQSGQVPPKGGAQAANGASASQPSPTRFKRAAGDLLPKQLAEKAGTDPARRAEAEHQFRSLLQLYETTARNDRLPSDDLAYAMQYFVVNSYMIVHDLHDVALEKDPWARRARDGFERIELMNAKNLMKPTPLQERAVYQQLRAMLAADPKVTEMTDRQKQEMAELLAIGFGINFNTYMKGIDTGDDALVQQAHREAASQLQKLTGSPVERLKIDERGLTL